MKLAKLQQPVAQSLWIIATVRRSVNATEHPRPHARCIGLGGQAIDFNPSCGQTAANPDARVVQVHYEHGWQLLGHSLIKPSQAITLYGNASLSPIESS